MRPNSPHGRVGLESGEPYSQAGTRGGKRTGGKAGHSPWNNLACGAIEKDSDARGFDGAYDRVIEKRGIEGKHRYVGVYQYRGASSFREGPSRDGGPGGEGAYFVVGDREAFDGVNCRESFAY